MPNMGLKKIGATQSAATYAKDVPEKGQTQVMAQVNGLDEALTDLGQLLNKLNDRLMPVLRESDNAQGEGSISSEPTAPLASLLKSHWTRLENCNAMLRDMIQRMEL